MKAIILTKYGPPDVLQFEEVDKPVPRDNEVLIRIHAVSVNYGDLVVRNMGAMSSRDFHMPLPLFLPARIMFGWSKPRVKILGNEFAGEVVTVGNKVKRFKAGDRVFGYPGQSMGCYAEFRCMSENGCVAIMPEDMTFEEAAAVPYGALMALSILRKVNLQPGQKVLVNGASGGIGSAAVQLARNHYGAEVTGVCGTPRLEFVKALGAEKVIDYTREDFTQSNETYDLVFDVLGLSTFSRSKRVLKPDGTYLLASFKTGKLLQMLWTKITGSKKKVICAMASDKAEDLISVKQLIEAGKIKAIIDKRFPLENTAEAHRYVEEGQKKGNVVITVG
jgi:NADPH:quinone reductase-like Zn-dependent oxidoreductase